MNDFVITLLVKMSLLIAAAAIADALMRGRTSAAARHLVWTLAFVGVLTLPMLSIAVPSWELRVLPAASQPVERPSLATDGFAPAQETPALGSPIAAASASTLTTTSSNAVSATPTPTTPRREIPWTTLALGVYAAGVGLALLHLLAGRWSLRRLVRQSREVTDPEWLALIRDCENQIGVARPVRLLRSVERSMPMAFGVVTPTIVIPAIADTWSADRRRSVLLHELAHVARHDCLTQLLAAIACSAYWAHPGVWWMSRRLRVERELACDDRVLKAGTEARDYATHLLELAYSLGSHRTPALVVSMARPRQLEGRMLAVLDAARNRVAPGARASAAGVLALAFVVVPLAAADMVVVEGPLEMRPSFETRDETPPALAPSLPQSTTPETPHATVPATESLTSVASAEATQSDRGDRRRREIRFPGTWEIRNSDDGTDRVYLRVSERPNNTHGSMVALSELEGLSRSLVSGGDGPAKFQMRRDAGTIVFDGVFRSGIGGGTFDFTPSPTFPAEMSRRGFESPDATEQYLLARGNIGFTYLDELTAQKYEKPTTDDLVRAADHGVHLTYLREMGSAGYRLGKLSALIRTRDHGVTPEYVRALAEAGYKNLTADELVRARDHGVTPEYVETMKALGYASQPLENLIRARDHGVTSDYVRGLAEHGFQNLPLDTLVRARDHGVTPDFMKGMRDAGYATATIEELVRARDHGVTGDYARGIVAASGSRPPLDELVRARDHGVSVEFAKAWKESGQLPILSDMVTARDHGVSAEYIQAFKAIGYDKLSVDDLVRLRDHGVTSSFAKEQNATSTVRLSVEQLVRRRSGRW